MHLFDFIFPTSQDYVATQVVSRLHRFDQSQVADQEIVRGVDDAVQSGPEVINADRSRFADDLVSLEVLLRLALEDSEIVLDAGLRHCTVV